MLVSTRLSFLEIVGTAAALTCLFFMPMSEDEDPCGVAEPEKSLKLHVRSDDRVRGAQKRFPNDHGFGAAFGQ